MPDIFKELDLIEKVMSTRKKYSPQELVDLIAPATKDNKFLKDDPQYIKLRRYVREILRKEYNNKGKGRTFKYTFNQVQSLVEEYPKIDEWLLKPESRELFGILEDAHDYRVINKEIIGEDDDVTDAESISSRKGLVIPNLKLIGIAAALLIAVLIGPFIAAHVRYDSDMIRRILKEQGPLAAIKVGIYSKEFGIKLYYDTAYAHFYNGDLATARQITNDIISDEKLTHVDYARAWFLDALISEAQGDVSSAFNSLDKSEEYYASANMEDGVSSVFIRRAKLMILVDKSEEAVSLLLSIDPETRSEMHGNQVLISALIVLDRHEEAEELSYQALNTNDMDDKINAIIRLHLIHQALNEKDEAWSWLLEALAISINMDDEFMQNYIQLLMYRQANCTGFQAPTMFSNIRYYIVSNNLMHLLSELEKPCIN